MSQSNDSEDTRVLRILRNIVDIANTGLLPDGDGVNVSTLLWAENSCRSLGLVCPSCDDMRADCVVCGGTSFGWFNTNKSA